MALTIHREHPLATDENGKLLNPLAVLFVDDEVLVTGQLIHALLVSEYIDRINTARAQDGQPLLTPDEENAVMAQAVFLVMKHGAIYIRSNPDDMTITLRADALLQTIAPKPAIRFLGMFDDRVRLALKKRGEIWRINTLPTTGRDRIHLITAARSAISDRTMYYYNMERGTRYITFEDFSALRDQPPEKLAAYLTEIRDIALKHNASGQPELEFFMAGAPFGLEDYAGVDFFSLPADALRACHDKLVSRLRGVVSPEFRHDDVSEPAWRDAMFLELVRGDDETVAEEILMGLCPEFFLHIRWLAGARIKDGVRIVYDSLYDDYALDHDDPLTAEYCDLKVKGFIRNFLDEFKQLEYVNIGRVTESLSKRRKMPGRRGVYIAQVKIPWLKDEKVKLLRMQQFDTINRIADLGESRRQAEYESREYTRYFLDRHAGCRKLGMNLLPMFAKTVEEPFGDTILTSTYFERDFFRGMVTDKIHISRYKNREFAYSVARLLGSAAAPNLIVGRMDTENKKILFNDGDEILWGKDGIPCLLIVTDHTGSFSDYESESVAFAADYAEPVNRIMDQIREEYSPNEPPYSLEEFARLYVEAFINTYRDIREHYHQNRKQYDTLFSDRPADDGYRFPHRWQCVLKRLDVTDPVALGQAIAQHISVDVSLHTQ